LSVQFISPPRVSDGNKYLSTWKEIAQYFGRGVRTVQRWEECLGMPVRRPHGRSRSAVMAIASELDQWMASCSTREAIAMLNNHPESNGEQGPDTLHLLVIEDSPGPEQQWEFLGKKLANRFIVESVRDLQSALQILDEMDSGRQPAADLVILDQSFFSSHGHHIFNRCLASSRLKNAQVLVRPAVALQQPKMAA
jgi:hypothetical protein